MKLVVTRSKPHYSSCLIFLIAPVLLFIIPAAIGHPAIFGDNATQNEPLRWLVGMDWRRGILPAWNPFDWSGTPLLAGFNAGALYPLIAWYVLLPPAFATSMALASAWYISEFAVYGIARRYGISRNIAAIAAVVFVVSGSFLGQVVHLDMIEGDTAGLLSVWALMALLDAKTTRSRLLASTLLAAAFSAVVLAGAPEAMLAFLVALSTIALVRIVRKETALSTLAWIAPAAILALGLAAPQWLPGLSYVAVSTRSHLPANYAGSGPFSWIFLPLTLFPFAYGGYQGDYLPSYFGNYNPSEITVTLTTAGIIFLVIALTVRRMPTFRARAEVVTLLIVGVIFALGSHTPVAQLIYRLPLFSLQRLASRYLIDVNLAAILLAAAGLQHWWTNRPKLEKTSHIALWLVFAVSAAFAAAAGFFTDSTLTLFRVNSIPTGSEAIMFRVYLAVQLLLIFAAIWTVTGRKIPRLRPVAVLSGILLVETINLSAQFVWAPAYHQTAPFAQAPAAANLIAGPFQRYGVYDPSLYAYYRTIPANEQPDRNVFSQIGSIQGYASLSLAGYNGLTGTKIQSTLQPNLIPRYQRLLNLDLVITAANYFNIDLGSSLPTTLPQVPPSYYPAANGYGVATAFAGDIAQVNSIDYLGPRNSKKALITLTSPKGTTAVVVKPHTVVSTPITDLTTVTIHSKTPWLAIHSAGRWYLIAGPLTSHLLPRHWRPLIGKFGTLDFLAKMQRKSVIPQDSAVTVTTQRQNPSGTVDLTLTADRATVAQTILAWAPGWSASGNIRLVDERGLLALSLRKGRHKIVLSYHAPGSAAGFAIGGLSLGLLLGGLALYFYLGLKSRTRKTKVP